MFQSVTYTGFEKHPERRAWVEKTVMPLAEEVLLDDAATLDLHWHDPDVDGAPTEMLTAVVRDKVLSVLADRLLLGEINGDTAFDGMWVHRPGVLLGLTSSHLPPGWTWIPLPAPNERSEPIPLRRAIRSIHLTMLESSLRKRVERFGQDPIPAGV